MRSWISLLAILSFLSLSACAKAPEGPLYISCQDWMDASDGVRSDFARQSFQYYAHKFPLEPVISGDQESEFSERFIEAANKCEELGISPFMMVNDVYRGREVRARPTFAGLTLDSTCQEFNQVSPSSKIAFVRDIVIGTSSSTGRNLRPYEAEIQSCAAAALAEPCVGLTLRDTLAACFALVAP